MSGQALESPLRHQSIDPPPSSWETQTKPYANSYIIGLLLTLLLLTIFIIRRLISFASNTWISTSTKRIWRRKITQMSLGRWYNNAPVRDLRFFGSFQSQMWFSVCDLRCHQHLLSLSHSLSPFTVFWVLVSGWLCFRVNPDSLDLQPGTVATGQARPQKVTLLAGHCGLEADIGSLSKQVVLVSGRPRAASTRVCICTGVCVCMCVCVCVCVCQAKVWMYP